MTPAELEANRVKLKLLAHSVILEWLTQQFFLIALRVPEEERGRHASTMLRQLQTAKTEYSQIAFPELGPALSDLTAAEAEDAFEAVAAHVRDALSALAR